MIITPLFCKLKKPLTISKKLGLALNNIKEEDRDYLLEVLGEELKQFNITHQGRISLQNIMFSDYYMDIFKNINPESELECLGAICDNILTICVKHSKSAMLRLMNKVVYNPTCEMSIEEKFIRFFSFVERSKPWMSKQADIHIAYNDHEFGHYTGKTDIIGAMAWRVTPHLLEDNNPYRYATHSCECEYKIECVIEFGQAIDKYIESEQDFFVIDYLIDTVSSRNYGGFTEIINMTAMLELLLAKSNHRSLRCELRDKLPQFLSEDIDNKDVWVRIMYDIRSKVAHGDYFELIKKIDEYASIYMKDFEYDYYEYSKLNWVMAHLRGELSVTVARIIRTMLSCKKTITEIKDA